MDNSSPLQLLQIPSPDPTATLGFCEATPAALKTWLAHLPKANLGETSRQLYEALTRLKQLSTSADNRLHLLEVIRPEIYAICQQLERYFINQPVIMDAKANKVFNLCQALQNHLTIGYQQVLPLAASDNVQAMALQRAIHALTAMLLRANKVYRSARARLWLELHLLYEYACDAKVQYIKVPEPLAQYVQQMTVEQSYLTAVLISCARCNQLRYQAIEQLASALECWSTLALFKLTADQHTALVVIPRTDQPPRYRSQLSDDKGPHVWGINTYPLAHALSMHHSLLGSVPALDPDLLKHLQLACSGMIQRNFARTPAQGQLNICLGMRAVHYQLAGQRTFAELLKNTQPIKRATFSSIQQSGDYWAGVFDSSTRSDRGLPLTWINQLATNERSATSALATTAEEKPPESELFNLQIVDQSAEGYCLAWRGAPPTYLHVGEVLALRESPAVGGWIVATIRWIRQVDEQTTQIGVQLLSNQARACGIRLLPKDGQSSQYLRALLLPANEAIQRSAMLITPRMPFREHHKVRLFDNNQEYRAILGRRLDGTVAYNFFTYQVLDEPFHEPTPPTSEPNKDEDFDSLWKSL